MVTRRSDALVREAARLTRQPLSAFVEESAVARAESLVAEHRAMSLSSDDCSRVVDALDDAPVPVPELVELFSRNSQIPSA
jgi:uncharacterized protein (DUF1778 family)